MNNQEFTPTLDEYGADNFTMLQEEASSSNGKHKDPLATESPVYVKPFERGDLQPSYANEIPVQHWGWYESFIDTIGGIMGSLGTIPCCFCCPNPFKSVQQGEVGLVTKFGQFYKSVDPGLTKVNVLSEKLHFVDVMVQVLDVPHQQGMTKDNVSITLSSVLFYHVVAPHKAKFGVKNVIQALQERTQTTLRLVVGSRPLQDMIEKREEVAASIQAIIDERVTDWGIKVESILIKDIVLSQELQDSLALAAKSRRAGESKIINARAEVESAKLMRKAADILASKAAMQIRYLDAMQNMSKNAQSKVIFMPSAGAIENMADQASTSAGAGSSGDMNNQIVNQTALYESQQP